MDLSIGKQQAPLSLSSGAGERWLLGRENCFSVPEVFEAEYRGAEGFVIDKAIEVVVLAEGVAPVVKRDRELVGRHVDDETIASHARVVNFEVLLTALREHHMNRHGFDLALGLACDLQEFDADTFR